jgi:hypothetical protein
VLAGDLGSEGLTEQLTADPSAPRPQAHPDRNPDFPGSERGPGVVDQTDLNAAHLPYHRPAKRRHPGPLNGIFDKRYSVYWQVS